MIKGEEAHHHCVAPLLERRRWACPRGKEKKEGEKKKGTDPGGGGARPRETNAPGHFSVDAEGPQAADGRGGKKEHHEGPQVFLETERPYPFSTASSRL